MSRASRHGPVACLLTFALMPGAVGAQVGRTMSRQEFVNAISRVKSGVTQEEVRALLGSPDDIETRFDRRMLR